MENLPPTPTTPEPAMVIVRAVENQPTRAAFGYFKERFTALMVRGAVAFYDGNPTAARPTIAELLELATVALDIAHDHVMSDGESGDDDVRRIENTRRALFDVLHGCPTASLSKRDAFYTLGALLDAGFASSLADLVNGETLAHVCGAPPAQAR